MPNSTAALIKRGRKRSFVDDGGSAEHDLEREVRKNTLHMENQERAYVAASRRGDRSLEARYQSALMASEVHKKRTGKSLQITYKVVKNEEMYEEEDQRLPESSLSLPTGYLGRTWSQTDAYIAALIARKSGMKDLCAQTHALSEIPPFNNALNTAWATQASSTLAHDQWSGPPQHQPTIQGAPSEALSDLTESKANAASYLAGAVGPDLDLCFGESVSFPDIIPHTSTSSKRSPMSDGSTYDSNYVFDSSADDQKPRPRWHDVRPENCLVGLVDTDGEALLSLAQMNSD